MNENYRKKKQPQVVRAHLIEAAAEVASQRGLGGLTLDLVARRAGVSKGGLIHHFPNRAALIDGLFQSLLGVFEASVQQFIALDDNPRGRFTRAYIRATAAPRAEPHESKLLGAFALAMSHDEPLAMQWRTWFAGQMEKYGEHSGSVLGKVILYAADGIWLEDCTGVELTNPEQRQAVIEYLIQQTYVL